MFLFAPCQVGAERALKSEVAGRFPSFRVAFSRPGFLTFKMPDEGLPDRDVEETVARLAGDSVFARTAALSLGKADGADDAERAPAIWEAVGASRRFVNRIHVFRRDARTPGNDGFEPGSAPDLFALHDALCRTAPQPKFLGIGHADPRHPALPGETVLDIAEVDPDRYFVGIHTVSDDSPLQSCYPGGVIPLILPEDAVSRAWLKFEEGLLWSDFPIDKGTRCLDIGAAPGGASQVLLARGAEVLGVDPAEMHPLVLQHPGFSHIRGRINQTKRSAYRRVRWVFADMNVAPNYTLDVLEELVAGPGVDIRGMLFTLKLFQWSLADTLSGAAERIRAWGFNRVRIKQLAFNRREVMVAASERGGCAGVLAGASG